MVNIALFASGSGSNAENIINYFKKKESINISVIVSNKKDAYVHTRAAYLSIPSVTYGAEAFEDGTVLNFLQKEEIGFIVLSGFLLRVPVGLIDHFHNRIVNIHPALLPKFGGKGMYGDRVHRAVIAAGEKESGITIHYVNGNYDEGKIIFQAKCRIEKGDTYKDLANKVHALEYKYFPKIIEEVVSGMSVPRS